jgi:hypothetical protein
VKFPEWVWASALPLYFPRAHGKSVWALWDLMHTDGIVLRAENENLRVVWFTSTLCCNSGREGMDLMREYSRVTRYLLRAFSHQKHRLWQGGCEQEIAPLSAPPKSARISHDRSNFSSANIIKMESEFASAAGLIDFAAPPAPLFSCYDAPCDVKLPCNSRETMAQFHIQIWIFLFAGDKSNWNTRRLWFEPRRCSRDKSLSK